MIDFGKSARVALIALAIVSVVGTLTAMVFGEKFTTSESYQNDTYSRSAIGHRLFVDLLEESGRDVSIVETDERVFDDSPLFFIEPRVASTGDESDFSEQLDAALVSVLVLPKRIGVPDESREFIESHQVVPLSEIDDLVEIAGVEGDVTRVETLGAVTTNVFGLSEPSIVTPVQLLTRLSENAEVLFATDRGVLVARFYFDETEMIVVSDPDVLANHAVTEPANAKFTLGLVGALSNASEAIEIDETFHGYRQRPSFLRLMTTFPFSIGTIHFLLLIGLLTWSGLGRFGRPLSEETVVAYGPRGLIDNTATLFEPEHAGHLGQRYVWSTVRGVARQINAPEHLGRRELVTWLEEFAGDDASESIAELVLEIDRIGEDLRHWNVKDVMTIVSAVNRWKWEVLNER